MAFLVCIGFPLPLSASQTLIEEMNLRKPALGGLSIQATTHTGLNLLTPISSNRSISSASLSCYLPQTMVPSRCFWESAPSHLNVSAGTQTVLCGYWVGPDIEDGWGFVNAYINQIL